MTPAAAVEAAAEAILGAHRATAYFLRLMANLSAEEFDAPADSHSPCSRRALMSAVGNDARAYARLVEAVRTESGERRTYRDEAERSEDIDWGSTLPAHALRHLVAHAAVHLTVEWRDLAPEQWGAFGQDHRGKPLALADVPWVRTVEVWLAAIDLGAGGSFADVPAEVLRRMAADARLGAGVRFEYDDATEMARAARGGTQVTGALADVVRWLHGRGDRYLSVTTDPRAGAADGTH